MMWPFHEAFAEAPKTSEKPLKEANGALIKLFP